MFWTFVPENKKRIQVVYVIQCETNPNHRGEVQKHQFCFDSDLETGLMAMKVPDGLS